MCFTFILYQAQKKFLTPNFFPRGGGGQTKWNRQYIDIDVDIDVDVDIDIDVDTDIDRYIYMHTFLHAYIYMYIDMYLQIWGRKTARGGAPGRERSDDI